MSREAVARFLTEANENSELQQQAVAALSASKEGGDSFLSVASKHGYEFTAEEFAEVLAASKHQQAGELSDDDLDQVAGGWAWVSTMPIPIPQPADLQWAYEAEPILQYGALPTPLP